MANYSGRFSSPRGFNLNPLGGIRDFAETRMNMTSKARTHHPHTNTPQAQVTTKSEMDIRSRSPMEVSPPFTNNNDPLQESRMTLTPTKRQALPNARGCICNREHTNVACCSCGLVLEGRVRLQCPRHPNTIHLMDVERCPECCSTTLSELRITGQATGFK
ncbi:uncharacterized protein [Diadema setosum]|uniref:uncharacterized protein n=1 Tax=Diadema setosum TaxID=31175 RepID=UPI003B3AD68C